MALGSMRWMSALLLAPGLCACGGAAGQVATGVAQAALDAAASSPSSGNDAAPSKQCSASSCSEGRVCDDVSGLCVTPKTAARLARARNSRPPPYEVPPDPCRGRCKEGERCELRGDGSACVADDP